MTPEIQVAILGGIFLLLSTLLTIFFPRWFGRKEERLRKKQDVKAKRQAEAKNRYTDNGNGTVTDNRTGLIWLKNANCFGEQEWQMAMQSAAKLADGQCGLSDGSKQGDWHLPTKAEWKAMIDKKYVDKQNYSQPTLSNAAGTGKWQEDYVFSDVQSSWYWSSSSHTSATYRAWGVNLDGGGVGNGGKALTNYVWPVRGGQ